MAETILDVATVELLKDGDYVHELLPDGPRLGQPSWEFPTLSSSHAHAERSLSFEGIPEGYLPTVQRVLLILGRPAHPALAAAGFVHPSRVTPLKTLGSTLGHLRALSTWGVAHDLYSFTQWTASDLEIFLTDLRSGKHRANGQGLTPSAIRAYVTTIKRLHTFAPALPSPLQFAPWLRRTPQQVGGEKKSIENLTPPLPWTSWSALVAGSWFVIKELSSDILAGHCALRKIPISTELSRGPAGDRGLDKLEGYLSDGGMVPLHTGFGRGKGTRGTVNYALLGRNAAVSSNLFKPAHHNYREKANKLVERAVQDGQAQLGALIAPSAAPENSKPYFAELGLGEAEYLSSVLRAACYVLLASLSGMRDSELQELRRGCLSMRDGANVLVGRQVKGTKAPSGSPRSWWVPAPAVHAVKALEALSATEYLFDRSTRRSNSAISAYAPERDIKRLLEFINSAPELRPGRGCILPLASVKLTGNQSVNATSLRRSFAVHASRYPGAELGLGIQLGHASLRMTSGYAGDGSQQVVKMLDAERSAVVSREVIRLTRGEPLTEEAGRQLVTLRAQLIHDPARSRALAERLADQYHLGTTNDCFYRPASAACGTEGPELGSGFCAGGECSNAVIHASHVPALLSQVERLDRMLSRPKLNPSLESRIRTQRTRAVTALNQLQEKL